MGNSPVEMGTFVEVFPVGRDDESLSENKVAGTCTVTVAP